MQIERELKFRLSRRAAGRLWQHLPAVAKRARLVESVYYDTPLMELRSAQAALRLRRDGRKWLQTLKLAAGPNPGLAARYEWEVAAPQGALDLAALPMREVESAAGSDLRPTLLRARPVFATRFERRSARFALGDGTRVEACLDRGWIHAGRRRAPLLELEIELLEGQVASLLSFAEELISPLGLVLELRSKAERGYRLAAGEAAAPVKASRPAFDCRGDAADALAAASLAALAQIAANLDGVAGEGDPEYLHQARVGMRRLRSSLRAWRQAEGNRAQGIEKALRGFSAAFGPARDWDVFVEMMESRLAPKAGGKARFAALLRRARASRLAARREAAGAAVSAQCQLFLLQAMRWVHEAPWRPVRGSTLRPRSASAFAREQLSRIERRAARHGAELDWRDAPARHQLRIRLKRLRYMAEFFARCFPARATERYIDRLKGLQDLLGELNDLAVARGLIGRIDQGPAAAAARRVIAARERTLLRGLRPAWSRLRKTPRFWRRPG